MKTRLWIASVGIILAVAAIGTSPAQAHQPFFEETDITFESPWQIADPSISTAVYATLDRPQDVDYFTFQGRQGQRILLSLVIPQIQGQQDFAPQMALMGPGIQSNPGLPAQDNTRLPARVQQPEVSGVLLLPPPEGQPKPFFEPFSRTSYWNRQQQPVTLSADGRYTVAVWHASGEVGRYTFVIGEREVLGGDIAFPFKMRAYWTPVPRPTVSHTCQPH